LLALMRKIGHDDISNMSASIAYYATLSLFPLLLSLLAIFGLFLPMESVQLQLFKFLGQYLPGSLSIFEGNIPDIIRLRGALGIIGILGLIWSGSGVFSAITNSINKAWDIPYKHPFYLKKPREIAMLLGIGILFLLSLGASAYLTLLGNPNLPFSGVLINIGTAIIALLFSLAVFSLIHKIAPVVIVSWRYIWPGAVLSTVLFEVSKTLFIFYLNHFNHYDKIYGSITSVIILLIWVYYSAFILLLGAEFSYMLHRMKREGEAFDKSEEKVDLIKEC
jgi:membrane protein